MALAFGLQTLHSIDVTKIFRLKGLKTKNKGHTNFYECCDLTKKVYLVPGDFEHFVAAHPLAAAGLMPEDVSDD